MKVARWTGFETDILKLYYGTMPVDELIKKYFKRRTSQQIYNKVHRLEKSGYRFVGKTYKS